MPSVFILRGGFNLKIDGQLVPYTPSTNSVSSGESTYTITIGQTYTIESWVTDPRIKFSRYWGSSGVMFSNKDSAITTVTINADNETIIIYPKYKMTFGVSGRGTLSARSILTGGGAPDPDRKPDEWASDISGLDIEGYGWFEDISPVINHYPYKLEVTFTPVAPYQFYTWRGLASGTSPTTLVEIEAGNVYAITSIPITLRQTFGGTISDDSGVITSDASTDITKYYPYGFADFTATPSAGYNIAYWESSVSTNKFGSGLTVLRNLIGLSVKPYTIFTVTFAPVGVVCFLGDTPILTPSGYKPIRTIQNGDAVTTADGRVVRVCRVLKQRCAPELRVCPYIIPTGMFGALQDIAVSPNHEVSIPGKGMMKACSLNLERKAMNKPFYYYNLELEDWVNDNLVAAGVECESLAPAERIVLTKEEFMRLVESRYGYSAARRLRTVCFEESGGNVSMPKFRAQ